MCFLNKLPVITDPCINAGHCSLHTFVVSEDSCVVKTTSEACLYPAQGSVQSNRYHLLQKDHDLTERRYDHNDQFLTELVQFLQLQTSVLNKLLNKQKFTPQTIPVLVLRP